MRNLTFSELHSLIQNEQSFTRICRFNAEHVLARAKLTPAERDSLEWARIERATFLADRLAERAGTRRAA